MKTFEDYLKDQHGKQYVGTDDMMKVCGNCGETYIENKSKNFCDSCLIYDKITEGINNYPESIRVALDLKKLSDYLLELENKIESFKK